MNNNSYKVVKMPHRQWAILMPNGCYIFYNRKREATIVCERLNKSCHSCSSPLQAQNAHPDTTKNKETRILSDAHSVNKWAENITFYED